MQKSIFCTGFCTYKNWRISKSTYKPAKPEYRKVEIVHLHIEIFIYKPGKTKAFQGFNPSTNKYI